MDERFDQYRRATLDERPNAAELSAVTAQWLAALDAVLDRWSLADLVTNGGQPGLAEWLRQAIGATARVLDAAIHDLGSEERPQVIPPSQKNLEPAHLTPAQTEATSATSVPLVLTALLLVRRAWPTHRRRGSSVTPPKPTTLCQLSTSRSGIPFRR